MTLHFFIEPNVSTPSPGLSPPRRPPFPGPRGETVWHVTSTKTMSGHSLLAVCRLSNPRTYTRTLGTCPFTPVAPPTSPPRSRFSSTGRGTGRGWGGDGRDLGTGERCGLHVRVETVLEVDFPVLEEVVDTRDEVGSRTVGFVEVDPVSRVLSPPRLENPTGGWGRGKSGSLWSEPLHHMSYVGGPKDRAQTETGHRPRPRLVGPSLVPFSPVPPF